MISENQEKKLIYNEVFMSAVKETLESGLSVKFTVTGMSMWPFFTGRRDSVVVKKCDFSELKKGDIILFSPAEKVYLLHRVIKKTGKNFVTAGDGNTFTDGTFNPDTVIARVSQIHRKDKTFSADSKSFILLSKIWMSLFPIRGPILKTLKSFVTRNG